MTRTWIITLEQRQHAHRVIAEEAAKHGMTTKELLQLPKSRKYTDVKWHLWARLMYEVDLSMTWAGRFAKRDHTTLMHAMRKMGQEYYGLPFKSSMAEIGELWRAHNLAWREAA